MRRTRHLRERWYRALFALALAFTLLVSPGLATSASAASPTILLIIDGRRITPPQAPQLIDGSTFVPVRAVAEAFDLKVTWTASSQSIAIDGAVPITLQVGSLQAKAGDRTVQLAAAPRVVNGSTLVPLRALSELLGYEVAWDPDLPAVRIKRKPAANLAVAGSVFQMLAELQPWQVEATYANGLLSVMGRAAQSADLEQLSFEVGAEPSPVPLPVTRDIFTVRWPISEPGDYTFRFWRKSGTVIRYQYVATLIVRVVDPSQPPLLQGASARLEDLSVSLDGLRLTPRLTPEGVVALVGDLPDEVDTGTVQLICRRPCPDSDPKYIGAPVWEGEFRLPVVVSKPGVYHYSLRLNQSGKWVDLADFRLTQTAPSTLTLVQAVPEAGFELLSPAVGGQEVEGFIQVRGMLHRTSLRDPVVYLDIRPLSDDGKKTLGEYHQVLPIVDRVADGRVWLKLGPGPYKVNLFINENNYMGHDFVFASSFAITNRGSDELRYLAPGIGVESDDPRIIQLAAQITQGQPTAMAKVRAIHDWVAKNIAYDVEKYKNYTFTLRDGALLTLEKRMGVCQDYTYLTIALLRAQGIPSRYAHGTANGGLHAWVEAQIDGRWVTMDPTWDAGHVSGDRFFFSFRTKYFDPDPVLFAQDHTLEGYRD